MAYAQPPSPAPHPRIDVTSLAGVLVVLVALAIIALPPLERSAQNTYQYADLPSAFLDPVLVEITPEHAITWNGQKVDAGQFRNRLAVLAQASPQPLFQISALDSASWSDVSRVINEADDLGVRQIDLLSSADDEYWARQLLAAQRARHRTQPVQSRFGTPPAVAPGSRRNR